MRIAALMLWGLLALGPAVPAAGQDRVSLAQFLGAYLTDDDFHPFVGDGTAPLDPGVGSGAILGARLSVEVSPAWSAEATYGYTAFDVQGTVRTVLEPEGVRRKLLEERLHLYDATVRRSFGDPGGFQPFVVLGVGAVSAIQKFPGENLEPAPPFWSSPFVRERSETRLRWILGGGVTRVVGDRLSLRVDSRAHLRSCEDLCADDGTLTDLELSGGLQMRL